MNVMTRELWWDDASYAQYQGDPLADQDHPYEPTPFHVIADSDDCIMGRYPTFTEAAAVIRGTMGLRIEFAN